MRIGIISDIHSNLEALTVTISALERRAPDMVLCLGDVVGYGASVNECCELVRRASDVTLLGNHDAAVVGRMDYGYYYAAARHALDWTASRLSRENAEWLRSLPYVHQLEHMRFTHGSPVDAESFEYVFDLEQARDLLPRYGELAEVNFIGHSHLCKAFTIDPGGEIAEAIGAKLLLRHGVKHVVSVGSVGQPRDWDNRACYVTYETETRTVEYHRVPYDIEAAAKKITDAGLAYDFGKRLFLGI